MEVIHRANLIEARANIEQGGLHAGERTQKRQLRLVG